MHRLFLLTALSFFMLWAGTAQSQVALDNEHIITANKLLEGAYNCDGALGELRLVSDSGRTSSSYLLAMAKAFDCKENNQQAIMYYNRYLAIVPGADSVKRRIAALNDPRNDERDVARQQKNANNLYKAVKNGYTHNCISERDFIYGLSYNNYISNGETPFKTAINFFNTYQFPFSKNRALFEFSSSVNYMTGGRKNWFAQVFDVPVSQVISVPGTFSAAIDLSVSAVIINKHALAVTAGPTIGIYASLMPDVNMNDVSNTYSNPILFTPTVGLRVAAYFGKHLYTALAYTIDTRSSFSNDISTGTTVTPFNGNSIGLTAGCRGMGYRRR